ncbi:MAG: SufD family Fe-S cluster assembly protein [Candidatus Diapherotrites archaeon]|nr:SufD family Fe-S cluster assembly protein [Candidatus Diapherotrites archaeon]
MKNAKSASYQYINHKIKEIYAQNGITLLPMKEAMKKIPLAKRYAKKGRNEGYFMWVKKQPKFPLSSCVSVSSKNISQHVLNLLVVEKGIHVDMLSLCNALVENLNATHDAKGTIILKEGASATFKSIHRWGKDDKLTTNYRFVLEKDAKLSYYYKSLSPPARMDIKTTVLCYEGAKADMEIVINASGSDVKTTDTLYLNGDNASGTIKSRIVVSNGSEAKVYSQIVGNAAGRGHLDCQGMLLDNESRVTFIPKLIDKNKDVTMTHEASIGKISEEELNYLRSRGLSEDEAIELIVNGFLR